jgi:hypothetical protein
MSSTRFSKVAKAARSGDQMSRLTQRLGLVLGLLLSASTVPAALAQVTTSSVSGFVTDRTGAAVPAATVTIKEVQTGYSRSTATNEVGQYSILAIPAGQYTFTVQHAGFETMGRTGQAITQQLAARVDFVLQVGSVTQTVTVQGASPLLQTETPAESVTLTSQEITDLPTMGHDYLQTAILSPGVTPVDTNSLQSATVADPLSGGQNYKTVGVSVTGGRPDFTAYNFNGVDVTDPGYGGNLFQPPPEAISSYRIVQGFDSAQYGGEPTVIYVNTKSGTNNYHGSLWEFNETPTLQARSFNSPGVLALHRNQPGGTFGGPLLPQLKDKTFVFAEVQVTRMHTNGPGLFVVPTAAEWNGDLSAVPEQLYNPFSIDSATETREPFSNNQIPSSLLSPIAQKYKQYVPVPNIANAPYGQYNLAETTASITNDTQFMIRVDQNLPHSGRLFADYFHDYDYSAANTIVPTAANGTPLKGDEAEIEWDQPLAPNKLNTLRVGFYRSWVYYGTLSTSKDYTGLLGFTNYDTDPVAWGFPSVNIVGGISVPSALGYDFNWYTTRLGLYDNFSFVKGRQTLNIGGTFQPTRYTLKDVSFATGTLSYSGEFTEQSPTSTATPVGLADFLLGAFTTSQSDPTGMTPWLDAPYYALYVQDNIQVSKKLSVSLGLRWDYWSPPVEKWNRWVSFDQNTGQLAYVLENPTEWQTNQTLNPAYPRGMFMNWKKTNFSPRLGIAYLLTPRTTIRAGGGIYYAQGLQNFQDFSVFSGAGTPPFDNSVTVNNNPSVVSAPPMLDNTLFPRPAIAEIAPGSAITAPDIHAPQPYTEQVTFSIQRQLGGNSLITAGYNGNFGHDLTDGGSDINQAALYNPADPLPLAQRRPYPNFDFIYLQSDNSNSTYNGGYLSFQKRYSNGLVLTASYTWAKSMDEYTSSAAGGDNQNARCIRCDYGLSDNNRADFLSLGYVWDLPLGPGSKFVNQGVGSKVLGNWRLSGITEFMTGTPLTVTTSGAYINVSDFTNQPRTNRVCNGNVSQRTLNEFFNTACFPLQPPNTFGNEGRNVIIGPGAQVWNMSLARTFKIKERFKLNLRMDTFSVFNHQNWGAPVTSDFSSQIGEILSKNNPRTIELGVNLQF